MSTVYITNDTRLKLGTLTGSVIEAEEVIAAMIASGNDDLYVPGISNASGGIVEFKVLTPGSGYANNSFNDVPLVNVGTGGLFATIDIQWIAGSIASVIGVNPGQAYKKGDQLTVNPADVGGTGSGLVFEVVLVQPQ